MFKESKIIIVSGASGSGKTTLVNHLLSCLELNLSFSVSACTRKKRSLEKENQHYKFISNKEFQNKISSGDFLEWEEVYQGCFYGTFKHATIDLLKSGKSVLFDVDVHGAQTIKRHFKDQAISIFIQAPSMKISRERLINRRTDSKEALKIRLDKIKYEIEIGKKMDCQLFNDELNTSKKEIYNLVLRFLKQ